MYILWMNENSFPSASSTTVDLVSALWVTAATLTPEGTEVDALCNIINSRNMSNTAVLKNKHCLDSANVASDLLATYGAMICCVESDVKKEQSNESVTFQF